MKKFDLLYFLFQGQTENCTTMGARCTGKTAGKDFTSQPNDIGIGIKNSPFVA